MIRAAQTYPSLYPSKPPAGKGEGVVGRGHGAEYSTNRHHHGIRHSTFKIMFDVQCSVFSVQNTSVFDVQCSVFGVFYGSSRIGMLTQPEPLSETPTVPVAHSQPLGLKVYEFSNHLDNVLTTFSDRKIATEVTPGYVAYYTAEILSSTDYYPFGFEMPDRSYTGGGYRYGSLGPNLDALLESFRQQ